MDKENLNNLLEWMDVIETRIQIINDRTKSHTLDIKKLEKQMKEIKLDRDIYTKLMEKSITGGKK